MKIVALLSVTSVSLIPVALISSNHHHHGAPSAGDAEAEGTLTLTALALLSVVLAHMRARVRGGDVRGSDDGEEPHGAEEPACDDERAVQHGRVDGQGCGASCCWRALLGERGWRCAAFWVCACLDGDCVRGARVFRGDAAAVRACARSCR